MINKEEIIEGYDVNYILISLVAHLDGLQEDYSSPILENEEIFYTFLHMFMTYDDYLNFSIGLSKVVDDCINEARLNGEDLTDIDLSSEDAYFCVDFVELMVRKYTAMEEGEVITLDFPENFSYEFNWN